VELVDLPAEDLRQRLREGKVYVPEQAAEAARHFFREGNLIALRELALRRTADRVDAQMQRYRRDHAIQTTWPVTERILVCVGPSPFSAHLVRAGRRLATRLGAEWVVAYIETPDGARLAEDARARVLETLRLAESLGAETVILSAPRMSDEILSYARSRNVSKIVIGKPGRPLWKRLLLGSIVDALVRGSGDIDIYVISGDRETEPTRRPRARPRPLAWPPDGRPAGPGVARPRPGAGAPGRSRLTVAADHIDVDVAAAHRVAHRVAALRAGGRGRRRRDGGRLGDGPALRAGERHHGVPAGRRRPVDADAARRLGPGVHSQRGGLRLLLRAPVFHGRRGRFPVPPD